MIKCGKISKTRFYYLYPILSSEPGQVVIEAALSLTQYVGMGTKTEFLKLSLKKTSKNVIINLQRLLNKNIILNFFIL